MKYLLIICLLFLGCTTTHQQSVSVHEDIFEYEVILLYTVKQVGKYYSGSIKTDTGNRNFFILKNMTYVEEGKPRLIGIVCKETYKEIDYNDYEIYHLYLPKEIIERLK